MAIPLNLLSDRSGSYRSRVDYVGLRNDIASPTRYVLNITNRCNLRCDMCTQVNEYGSGGFEMEEGLFDQILQQTAWTYPSYTLFGGEPLMHGKFATFVEKIRTCDCVCEVVTNGMLLQKYIDVIAHPKTNLHISMSGSRRVHNAIKHSEVSYERIIKAVTTIKIQHPDYMENVHVNCVVLPENVDSILEMIRELSSLGVLSFTIQHPQWEHKREFELYNKEWKRVFGREFAISMEMHKDYVFNENYFRKLLQLEETLLQNEKLKVNFYPEFDKNELRLYYDNRQNQFLSTDSVCLAPWMNPTIEPNGDIKGCTGFTVGNLKRDDFWKIWNGEVNNRFRRELMLRECFPVCKRCCLFYDKYL